MRQGKNPPLSNEQKAAAKKIQDKAEKLKKRPDIAAEAAEKVKKIGKDFKK